MRAGERFTPNAALACLRRRAGLSVEDVASRARVAPALVVLAEQDDRLVGPRMFGLLARVVVDALATT